MYFQLLGPLEVSDQGRSVVVGGGKRRSLLALLLLHANEVVSAERLIDELWGERAARDRRARSCRSTSPSSGASCSARTGSLTRAGGYVLRSGRTTSTSCASSGHSPRASGARRPASRRARPRCCAKALALWRGPPLADFSYEPFAQREIARLEELRLVALEERIDADLALGRHAQLVGELGRSYASTRCASACAAS